MKAQQVLKRLNAVGVVCDQFDSPEKCGCDWDGGPGGKLGVIMISAMSTSSGKPLLLCVECAAQFAYQREHQRGPVEAQ